MEVAPHLGSGNVAVGEAGTQLRMGMGCSAAWLCPLPAASFLPSCLWLTVRHICCSPWPLRALLGYSGTVWSVSSWSRATRELRFSCDPRFPRETSGWLQQAAYQSLKVAAICPPFPSVPNSWHPTTRPVLGGDIYSRGKITPRDVKQGRCWNGCSIPAPQAGAQAGGCASRPF